MLTNTDKWLGPFFRWRSTAKVWCDGEGAAWAAREKVQKKKKKERERKKSGSEDEAKDKRIWSKDRDKPLCVLLEQIWICTLQSCFSPPPKKIPKRWAKFNSKPPSNSSCDFLRPYLRRAGSTGVHVHGRTHQWKPHITASGRRSNEILVNKLVLSGCSNPHLHASKFPESPSSLNQAGSRICTRSLKD